MLILDRYFLANLLNLKLHFVMEKLKENFVVEDMRGNPFSKENLKDRSLVIFYYYYFFFNKFRISFRILLKRIWRTGRMLIFRLDRYFF